MKKVIFFIVTVIIIISVVAFSYMNYKIKYRQAQNENQEFEYYYNKEIKGTDIATVINKAVDVNEKNEVVKDNNNVYIENDTNSIKIEIKFIDTDEDTIYKMESLYNGGMSNFVQYYGSIKFKCTEIEYHKKTNKIKRMFFEQITS